MKNAKMLNLKKKKKLLYDRSRRDSNPGPLGSQVDALPTELNSRQFGSAKKLGYFKEI